MVASIKKPIGPPTFNVIILASIWCQWWTIWIVEGIWPSEKYVTFDIHMKSCKRQIYVGDASLTEARRQWDARESRMSIPRHMNIGLVLANTVRRCKSVKYTKFLTNVYHILTSIWLKNRMLILHQKIKWHWWRIDENWDQRASGWFLQHWVVFNRYISFA